MFKQRFKYYKSKDPPPNLSSILDFSSISHDSLEVKQHHFSSSEPFFGLTPPKQWEVYELRRHPGLIFISNPFTTAGQRYWCVRCLKDYPKKPNKTNLDVHNLVPGNENWWEYSHKTDGSKKLIEKLRWVTFGYHHDWDTKVYSESSRNTFPRDLGMLCEYLADILAYPDFRSEAAIVNYYHLDSTLSGHTDHSEENLEAPLFSFSFGQTAIFLLGGKNIEDDATPMFLQSGDIIVMSKESRLCYHGVPKILQTKSAVRNFPDIEKHPEAPEDFPDIKIYYLDPDLWKPFSDYLKYSRININVRQVLKNGQTSLNC